VNVKNTVLAVLPPFLKVYARQVEASPLGYRLARGAFWSVAGAVISRGLGIASSIVVARTLGKVGFGELGIINSTTMMFQLFAGFGLGLTATKYVAEHRRSDPLKAGRIIGMSWIVTAVTGGICAVLLAVFAPWLAVHALAAPHLSGLLRITAIALFISALNAAQGGALSGFEAFKTIATLNLIAGLFSFPIMITGVLLAGLKGAVWATVVSCAANWFICHLAVRKEARRFKVPLTFSGCSQELPLIWEFSLPVVLGGMMVTPVNWVCNAMLVNQPNGYAEMGIFSAANQWRTAILFVPGTIGAVVLPVLSNLYGVNDRVKYKKVLWLNIVFTGSVALFVAVPIAALSSFIMASYGTDFKEGWITLVLLSAVAVITATLNVVGQAIASASKMWSGFILNLIWAVTFLVATWFLKDLGATGLALATLLSYGVHLVTVSLYTRFAVLNSFLTEKA